MIMINIFDTTTIKNKQTRLAFSIFWIGVSSLLQTFTIQSFMDPSNLLSSGFTGLAILINKITTLFGVPFSVSLGILCLNIPAALLCCKHISKRFTLLSCIQFSLTSVLLDVCHFQPIFDDLFLNVIFGGFLYGLVVVIALRTEGSTGGTDFIALYISDKLHKSIWDQVFIFNVCIIVIFGFFFGWEYAGYSIVFQFISTKTISYFYHRYAQIMVEVTTSKPKAVSEAFKTNFRHGMSIVNGQGGYSGKPFSLCKTIVSSYEEKPIIDCLHQVDPDAIVYTHKIDNFYGRFYQKPIE
ncbi:YitT family protein [uncultured Dubosiella sp.]|uniref:YitT family protein n=3 Tax=uncultured Dubosiella sp. TaxID=1937011 RepID=UPI0025992EF8|nr:YitT family protein [uncultured Dubosiella sp.]